MQDIRSWTSFEGFRKIINQILQLLFAYDRLDINVKRYRVLCDLKVSPLCTEVAEYVFE
jgi:hypothetical protein